MRNKLPQSTSRVQWTEHSLRKMQFYGLSASRVLRVFGNPKRKELGVAPGTVAHMAPVSPKRASDGKLFWKSEIWVMYQPLAKGKIRIITAWRYPGRSPIRDVLPIPDDIIAELKKEGLIL